MLYEVITKGPKHGGANIMVRRMIDNIKENVDYHNKEKLREYLIKILKKEAFNNEGLIYGMGHAIYTHSDPRAVLLKKKAYELAQEKEALKELELYRITSYNVCYTKLLRFCPARTSSDPLNRSAGTFVVRALAA